MELKKVTQIEDIKEGDTIVITGDVLKNEPVKIAKIKVSETDGVEVIFDLKKNRFFNLGMFLSGKSWVKECSVIA